MNPQEAHDALNRILEENARLEVENHDLRTKVARLRDKIEQLVERIANAKNQTD